MAIFIDHYITAGRVVSCRRLNSGGDETTDNFKPIDSDESSSMADKDFVITAL